MLIFRWAALMSIFLFACSTSNKTGQGKGTTGTSIAEDRSRCDVSGKEVVKLDLNRDNQPDVWKMYQTKTEAGTKLTILTCKEVDLNFDGRKDMWNYYSDRGDLVKEEFDLDYDGRIDLITFRRAGKIYLQQLDTNYDGKPDIWKKYENGILVRVERDSNYNGKVDYREFYEGEKLDRINFDKDGDGRLESWERLGTETPLSSPKTAPSAPAKK